MKVSDALQYMSKTNLHRTIDSFTRDLPKKDVEHSRELILKNIDELTDKERIQNVLKIKGSFSYRILLTTILEVLINKPENMAHEDEIFECVVNLEKEILKFSKDPEFLKYGNSKNLEILKAVFEVALDDRTISNEEYVLIERLRIKLEISERNTKVLIAQLNNYPQKNNELHSHSQVKEALRDLQKRGILFHCNQYKDSPIIIPEEILPAVKKSLNIQLTKSALENLLNKLSKVQLSTLLEFNKLPKSGIKAELIERLIIAGVKPRASLDHLSNDELYEICGSLPGVKVSGTKLEKIDRIIDYFSNILTKDVAADASPGENYYTYLENLANRDREILLTNKIISKDIEMNNAFEEGTRYLFQEKLGLELVKMSGTEHPDGCIKMKNERLLMWDNKSKESDYTFPSSHYNQFRRYIQDSSERVSSFLIIVPKVKSEASKVARKLKVTCGNETDIAIITASDLKWLAETWSSKSTQTPFNLHVFNFTGILDKEQLKEQMEIFL